MHRKCAETAAVSRGTSHVTTKQRCKYTTSADIQKRGVLKLQALIQSRMRLERGGKQKIALYRCQCEELSAHLEMRRSRSVQITITQ